MRDECETGAVLTAVWSCKQCWRLRFGSVEVFQLSVERPRCNANWRNSWRLGGCMGCDGSTARSGRASRSRQRQRGGYRSGWGGQCDLEGISAGGSNAVAVRWASSCVWVAIRSACSSLAILYGLAWLVIRSERRAHDLFTDTMWLFGLWRCGGRPDIALAALSRAIQRRRSAASSALVQSLRRWVSTFDSGWSQRCVLHVLMLWMARRLAEVQRVTDAGIPRAHVPQWPIRSRQMAAYPLLNGVGLSDAPSS